jgi:hypothetical protein
MNNTMLPKLGENYTEYSVRVEREVDAAYKFTDNEIPAHPNTKYPSLRRDFVSTPQLLAKSSSTMDYKEKVIKAHVESIGTQLQGKTYYLFLPHDPEFIKHHSIISHDPSFYPEVSHHVECLPVFHLMKHGVEGLFTDKYVNGYVLPRIFANHINFRRGYATSIVKKNEGETSKKRKELMHEQQIETSENDLDIDYFLSTGTSDISENEIEPIQLPIAGTTTTTVEMNAATHTGSISY